MPLIFRRLNDNFRGQGWAEIAPASRPRIRPRQVQPKPRAKKERQSRLDLPFCRHCLTRRANKRRGLCWTCYYTPAVRDLYPSESKFARQGVGNVYRSAPLPAERTAACPGSEAKILVMIERAARREQLFRPDDGPENVVAVGSSGPMLVKRRADGGLRGIYRSGSRWVVRWGAFILGRTDTYGAAEAMLTEHVTAHGGQVEPRLA